MEKLSRTKKYAELREKIANDREQVINTSDLSTFQNKLNNISSEHFEKVDVKEDINHDPIHVRREELLNEPKKEEIDTFNNDYLNSYINEVKEYNKQKGLLTSEDTQSNILNEIRNPGSGIIRPFGDIDLNDASNLRPFKPINADDYEVDENKLNETISIPFVSAEELNNTISLEIKNLLKDEHLMDNNTEQIDNDFSGINHKPIDDQLLNETIQMVVEPNFKEDSKIEEVSNDVIQINNEDDEYDDEYDDEEYKEGNNRIINFVLICLILIFLVALGFIAYWILLQKGII